MLHPCLSKYADLTSVEEEPPRSLSKCPQWGTRNLPAGQAVVECWTLSVLPLCGPRCTQLLQEALAASIATIQTCPSLGWWLSCAPQVSNWGDRSWRSGGAFKQCPFIGSFSGPHKCSAWGLLGRQMGQRGTCIGDSGLPKLGSSGSDLLSTPCRAPLGNHFPFLIFSLLIGKGRISPRVWPNS